MLPAWAERIFSRLEELGSEKTQAGLARACKIDKVSVSNWKGKGTATKMISGDNLVAAATYLGTTPEWIMTGRPHASQLPRLHLPTLNLAIDVLSDSGGEATFENLLRIYEELLSKSNVQTVKTQGDPSGADSEGSKGTLQTTRRASAGKKKS